MASPQKKIEQLLNIDLIDSMGDRKKLENVYSSLLLELFNSSFWSPSNPKGRKIHWRDAKSSREDFKEDFNTCGLYLFFFENIPLYLGKTTRSLWQRLRERYVVGPETQCQLAETYQNIIIDHGVSGFPDKLIKKFKKRGAVDRLQYSVEFARLGIDKIWFALLPIKIKHFVNLLERQLIVVANEWNLKKGYGNLHNKLHKPW